MTPDISASERAFIGSLLNSPLSYWEASQLVRPEMLKEETHREIFVCVRDLMEAGRNVTRSALEARLPAEYGDGLPYLPLVESLKMTHADAGSPMDYAEAIREDFVRKNLARAADAALKACRDPGKITTEIIATLETQLMDATRQATGSTIVSLGDAAQKALERTNENFRCKGEVQVGLRTGTVELDGLVGPIMGGDMVTIAAPSGHGKTSLAVQIMLHESGKEEGKPSLLISQEMVSVQIAERAIASWTEVSVRKQRAGEIDIYEFEKLREAVQRAKQVKVFIDGCGRQRTTAICSKIRSFHRQHGLACAAIDHVLLNRPEHAKWTKVETVEFAAMEFKELAKELQIPIFLLAQLTRGSQASGNTWRFTDQALYGGDAIKQASDVMLGVTLPRKWLKQREPDESDQRGHDEWSGKMNRWAGKAEVGALKMRDDDDGQWLTLPFDGQTYTFGTPTE